MIWHPVFKVILFVNWKTDRDSIVLGIGEHGVYTHATEFASAFWLKTYHATGMLGRASTTGTAVGSTLMRSSSRELHSFYWSRDRIQSEHRYDFWDYFFTLCFL